MTKRHYSIAFMAWMSMIAVDFLLHGGILARLYAADSPFLLPARDAFVRIPIGYSSFLLLSLLLVWLLNSLKIEDRRAGFQFGLRLGLIIWGALTLGLYSISTAPIGLLLGWWLGQALEMGIAGFIAGASLEGVNNKKIAIWVLLLLVSAVVITVVMQNTGIAPQMGME